MGLKLKWVVVVSVSLLRRYPLHRLSVFFLTYTYHLLPLYFHDYSPHKPLFVHRARAIWPRSAALPLMFVCYIRAHSLISALASSVRPNAARRDTDIILSYYQSDLPGQSLPIQPAPQNEAPLERTPLTRSASTASSTSAYTPESSPATSHKTVDEETSPEHHASDLASLHGGHQRRPSNLSEGGSDKRRVHIVEVQSSSSQHDSSTGIRIENAEGPCGAFTKRDLQSRGLAIVMPPDASPESFASISTPLTAPLASTFPHTGHKGEQRSSVDKHQRSASEAFKSDGNKTLHHKSSSRDIGIVGTLPSMSTVEPRRDSGQKAVSPIFQTPVSPSAPFVTPPPSETMPPVSKPAHSSMPTIGERTHSGDSTSRSSYSNAQPSHSHNVDRSTTSTSFSANDPLSYLYYEPGRHARAGPLPPPPRAMFNIDPSSPPPPRPPRMRSPSPVRSRPALDIAPTSYSSIPSTTPLNSKRSVPVFPHRETGTITEASSQHPARNVTNTPE